MPLDALLIVVATCSIARSLRLSSEAPLQWSNTGPGGAAAAGGGPKTRAPNSGPGRSVNRAYGTDPIASARGGPNVRSGRNTRSPSVGSPLQHAVQRIVG